MGSLGPFQAWIPDENISPSVGLLNFPVELLTEVMKTLEWDDVLTARQTCRTLCDVSKSRAVWLALFTRYNSKVEPRPFWPEKPLHFYTARELECFVLRWKSVDTAFTDKRDPTVRQLNFDHLRAKLRNAQLVKGGRWLIAGTPDGSLVYIDLDAPSINPRPLTPSPFGRDFPHFMHLSIEMDPNAPFLAFNLAVFLGQSHYYLDQEPSQSPPYGLRIVQVWRVTADVDDEGRVQGLTSTKLSSFYEERGYQWLSFVLRGNLVSYSVKHLDNYQRAVLIVNWVTANGPSLRYQRRVIRDLEANWLALLPGDRLLCRHGINMELYDCHAAPEVTQLSSIPGTEVLKPIWDYEDFPKLSHPISIQQSTRVLMASSSGLNGIIIPASPSSGFAPARVVDFRPGNLSGCLPCLGGSHAVFFSPASMTHTTLRYSWPDEGHCSIEARKVLPAFRNTVFDTSTFDEESGRVLVMEYRTKRIVILDFANPAYSIQRG